jgi:hypothetical protein
MLIYRLHLAKNADEVQQTLRLEHHMMVHLSLGRTEDVPGKLQQPGALIYRRKNRKWWAMITPGILAV